MGVEEYAGVGTDDAGLGRFLHGLPLVDVAGTEERAAAVAGRPSDPARRPALLDLAIRMVDLTTLEDDDTAERVRALAARALRPDPADPQCPPTAAVCVYGAWVPVARSALAGTGVEVAAVAGGFPGGRVPIPVKVAETAAAVAAGADEIDLVIDRSVFLAGGYAQVHQEITAAGAACRRPDGSSARLKVILETGELGSYDHIRRASWLALLAGADFIKTSTGKIRPAATLPATLVMMEAVLDFRRATGRQVGVKAAGGIRTAVDALAYLRLLEETLGEDWTDPHWFRFGASALLDDLVRARSVPA